MEAGDRKVNNRVVQCEKSSVASCNFEDVRVTSAASMHATFRSWKRQK